MSITRRDFLKSAAVAGVGALAPGLLYGQNNANSKPNIVLILPDEFRLDGIGTLGLAPVQTPNIDTIAQNGVTFSNCFTCGPLCMPARASLMTGQYVHEHGQWSNNPSVRDPSSPSHVRRMRDEAGYYTALIGKAHLDLVSAENGIPILNAWGFDYSDEVTGPLGLDNDPTNSWAKWIGDAKYGQFQAYMHYYKAHFETKNPWGTLPLDVPPPQYPLLYDLTSADHYDTYVGQRAADWIYDYHNSQSDQPFYLQANFPGPHHPETSTTDVRQFFYIPEMEHGLLNHPQAPISPLVHWSKTKLCTISNMAREQNREMRQIYFANQHMVDTGIGKILQALVDCGFDNNTWVFFSSDHGEMLGDHYLMYKLVFYESATKVPLIIRPPSNTFAGSWVSTALTDHLDLTTSILDLAGLSPMFADHGTSLLAKVEAGPNGPQAQQGKDQVISELDVADLFAPPHWPTVHQMMLRTQAHKMNVELQVNQSTSLIHPVELYDLVQDPNEYKNLIELPKYHDVRTDMLDRIKAFFPDALVG